MPNTKPMKYGLTGHYPESCKDCPECAASRGGCLDQKDQCKAWQFYINNSCTHNEKPLKCPPYEELSKLLVELNDEFYRQTGEFGLWNTGLYSSDFVKWILNNQKIDTPNCSTCTEHRKCLLSQDVCKGKYYSNRYRAPVAESVPIGEVGKAVRGVLKDSCMHNCIINSKPMEDNITKQIISKLKG